MDRDRSTIKVSWIKIRDHYHCFINGSNESEIIYIRPTSPKGATVKTWECIYVLPGNVVREVPLHGAPHRVQNKILRIFCQDLARMSEELMTFFKVNHS